MGDIKGVNAYLDSLISSQSRQPHGNPNNIDVAFPNGGNTARITYGPVPFILELNGIEQCDIGDLGNHIFQITKTWKPTEGRHLGDIYNMVLEDLRKERGKVLYKEDKQVYIKNLRVIANKLVNPNGSEYVELALELRYCFDLRLINNPIPRRQYSFILSYPKCIEMLTEEEQEA